MGLTAAQIRDRAAQELGVLSLGQALKAHDAARITQGYAEVYEQLEKDGLATWPYSGSVPNDFAPHVVMLTAENCLGTYGVSESRYARIMTAAQIARREIMKYASPDYVSTETPKDY